MIYLIYFIITNQVCSKPLISINCFLRPELDRNLCLCNFSNILNADGESSFKTRLILQGAHCHGAWAATTVGALGIEHEAYVYKLAEESIKVPQRKLQVTLMKLMLQKIPFYIRKLYKHSKRYLMNGGPQKTLHTCIAF